MSKHSPTHAVHESSVLARSYRLQGLHSSITNIDGKRGHLHILNRPIESWADRMSFEALYERLHLGSANHLPALRAEALRRINTLALHLSAIDPMDFMCLCLNTLPVDRRHQSAAVVATIGAALTVWLTRYHSEGSHAVRYIHAMGSVDQTPSLRSQAELLLAACSDGAPPSHKDALDRYWCTIFEHGLNASTFAARVTASTGADLASAVCAAIHTLKGPLHGGAPGPVLDMLRSLESVDDVAPYVHQQIDQGRRVMGFGHRVYRVKDPRATVLANAAASLTATGSDTLLQRALSYEPHFVQVLTERKPHRPLQPNVEYYTAVLLDALNFPPSAFSALFAAGRVLGWLVHIAEQRSSGSLLRPVVWTDAQAQAGLSS